MWSSRFAICRLFVWSFEPSAAARYGASAAVRKPVWKSAVSGVACERAETRKP
jgi:hypothetical protein